MLHPTGDSASCVAQLRGRNQRCGYETARVSRNVKGFRKSGGGKEGLGKKGWEEEKEKGARLGGEK